MGIVKRISPLQSHGISARVQRLITSDAEMFKILQEILENSQAVSLLVCSFIKSHICKLKLSPKDS